MNLNILLPFIAAASSGGIAVFVFLRNRRSFVHQSLAFGMMVLAIEAVFTGLLFNATSLKDIARWLYLSILTTSIVPGSWLLFSLSFSRSNYREFLNKWKWLIASFFLIPFSLVLFFRDSFFLIDPLINLSDRHHIILGWPGYVFYIVILLSSVIILMNLERTLRSSIGHMRWQVKFLVIGMGCLFAARIYTASQAVLFHSLNLPLEIINTISLLIACMLIAKSLFRSNLLNINFYLSQTFIYNSLTILLIGIYLITVGVLTKLSDYFNTSQNINLTAFVVMLSLVGLIVLLLSDRLRKKTRLFISRHLKRPLYDYRKEWIKFTQRTTSITDTEDLCNAVARMIADTLDVLSVSVWLFDESNGRLDLKGTTVFHDSQTAKELKSIKNEVVDIFNDMQNDQISSESDYVEINIPKRSTFLNKKFSQKRNSLYCFPLVGSDKLLGLLTLNDRVGYDPLSIEDIDLLKTISDQVAASLLNLMLSERLRQAKEMEAFQMMSAFFVHDMKNLASKLSLTMQNLPIHFDNPEFRKDALQAISQSLTKINAMCSRLTSLTQKLKLHVEDTDLNAVVENTLSGLSKSLRGNLIQKLQPLPKIRIDAEQLQKVLINLVLNANEAIDSKGEVTVSTKQREDGVDLSVEDNGCGIQPDFIDKYLFRPFQTTKKQGMGIGLYHSKMIVEAHNGRIEVESKIGIGTKFRILLPVNGDSTIVR